MVMLSKAEQRMAFSTYSRLASIISNLTGNQVSIKIEEQGEKLNLPKQALELLVEILQEMGKGNLVGVFPIGAELTTQQAANLLGCSRPFVVKLVDKGELPSIKVGSHRRLQLEDVMTYHKRQKALQKKYITELMHLDEEAGLYDS